MKRLLPIVLLLGLAAAPARAAWETVPELELRSENDDNVRMSPIDQGASSRAVFDARFRLRNFGERGNAYVEPRIVSDAYADEFDTPLESNDVFFVARGQYDWQKAGFGFDMGYADESVLRSEFDDALPDDQDVEAPSDGSAGTLGDYTAQRERSHLNFNLDLTTSERTTLRLESQRIDVSYYEDMSFQRARTPYDDTRAALSLIRRVDERNSVTAGAFVSQYNATGTSNSTDSYGVEGRFTRPVTQQWTMDLTAGVQRSDFVYLDFTGQTVDNAEANFTLSVTMRKRAERTSWNVGMGRYLNPSSAGFLEARNEVRASVAHEFSEKLRGQLGVRVAEYTPLNEREPLPNRRYGSATLEIEWAMRRRWFVVGGLDYADEQRLEVIPLQATSTMLYAGVTYRGLSRQ
jgi:hypothetical protein